jgi:predicted  nucleic acid-binding Zn-ribbon protein
MTDSEKFDIILEKLEALNEKYEGLNEKYEGLNEKYEGLNDKFEGLQKDVTKINLTLENEIRVNIQRVAEGHLDLSRNLHEAMKPSNEVEMLAIKVRMLETDMMEIKRKIS